MSPKNTVSNQPRSENASEIASNIERFLNNHTREGGHSWQSNMVARPVKWHPLPESTSTKETHLSNL